MSDSERIAISSLNVAHAHLSVDALANGVKKDHIPPLTAFVPEIHTEPEPLTFEDWAQKLLPLAGG